MKPLALKVFAIALLLGMVPGNEGLRADSSRDEAWEILRVNLDEKSADKRIQAVRALGLLPGNSRALQMTEKSAGDDKPEVRVAAIAALSQFHTKESNALIHKMLSDPDPSVVLAAAGALLPMKDSDAYDAYYEFLTGERKTGKGMIADQMKTLKDPKKMAELGLAQGIGFIPYAGIGYSIYELLRADDVSPIRAAAARSLANDPDPESGQALVKAAADKNWLVKAGALEAIARRGDPALRDPILPALMDDNTTVRCTAAAAVIRLSTPGKPPSKKP
jgi:HEAT repeat protein